MPTEMTKNYVWTRYAKASTCARGSIRTKAGSGKSKGLRLRICCPRGKWNARTERCRVGTKLISIGKPRRK